MKQTLAQKTAAEVMANLDNRKGLFDGVDQDVLEEIEQELAQIIGEAIEAEREGCAKAVESLGQPPQPAIRGKLAPEEEEAEKALKAWTYRFAKAIRERKP